MTDNTGATRDGLIEKSADWLAGVWTQNQLLRPVKKRLDRFVLAFRTAQIKHTLKSCGKQVGIQMPVIFAQPEKIEIGDGVSVGGFVHIWGGGGVRIGNRVMIGSHSAITSITHDYTKEIMITTVVTKPIVICDDAWLGAHVLILPGVTIGQGAVIGAGAVVMADVPPRTIVAGVPARVLKTREITA